MITLSTTLDRHSTSTLDQKRAALSLVLILSEAIRELVEVPSGVLYSQVCGHMGLDTYTSIIQTLKNAKLVKEQAGNVLVWIGPHGGVK